MSRERSLNGTNLYEGFDTDEILIFEINVIELIRRCSMNFDYFYERKGVLPKMTPPSTNFGYDQIATIAHREFQWPSSVLIDVGRIDRPDWLD